MDIDGCEERKVLNLSGCQWSHDYLFNRKELKKRTSSVFDKMLKSEIEKLEEGGSENVHNEGINLGGSNGGQDDGLLH